MSDHQAETLRQQLLALRYNDALRSQQIKHLQRQLDALRGGPFVADETPSDGPKTEVIPRHLIVVHTRVEVLTSNDPE